MDEAITKKQIQMIKIAQKDLRISDEDYLAILSAYNVDSCTQMTKKDAKDLIDRLEKQGFKPVKRKRQNYKKNPSSRENIVGLISPQQKKKIYALMYELAWKKDSLELYCQRMLKKGFPSTKEEASIIIEGMKKILGRR